MIIRDDVPAILSKDDCELSMEDIKGLYNASTYEPPFSYKRTFDAAVSDAVHQVSKIPTQLRAAGGQALIGLGQAAKEPIRLPAQGVKVEGNAFENVVKGKKAELVLPEKVIPEGGIIFDGANAIKMGDKLVEMGMLNVKTANRNLEELNAEYEKRRPLLSKEEQESWTYSIAAGGINYATMLGLSALNPMAGLGYMGALTLGGETEEGLEAYKKKHGSLEGYEGEAVTDLQINIANTGVQTLLEKVFGAPAQLQFFRSVREFAKAGVLGFTDEFTTELLQNVTDAVFDKLDERLVDSEGNEISIGTVIMNGIRDNVVAGMFGGGAGIAFATYNRAKVKERIAEVVAPVVEPEKVKRVVDDVYNAGSLSIQTIVTKELENSSSLKAKRGEVYEAMYNSAVKAIVDNKKQGGFQDLKTEEDIAAYAKNVADNHADWVLSEANRRGVAIDEVQTGSDISYENGRLVIGMTKGVRDLIARQESRLKDIKEVEKDLSELRGGRGAKKAEEKTIVQQLRKIGITKEFADRFDIRGLMGLQDEKFGASGLFRKTGKIHDEQSLLSYLHTLGYIEDVTDTAEGEAARWDKAMKILESGAIQDMNKKQVSDDASELYSLAGVDIQNDTAEVAKAKLDDFFAKKKDEAISGEIASLTDEEQERFAMMTVEGGLTDEQALNAIKATRAEEEGLPFPTFYQEEERVVNDFTDRENPSRITKRTIETLLPEEEKALNDYLDSRDDRDRILNNLARNKYDDKGNLTGYYKTVIEGIFTQQAVNMYFRGETPDFESAIDAKTLKGSKTKLKKTLESAEFREAKTDEKKIDVIARNYLAGSVLAHPTKVVNAVNSSLINCNPSLACAKFCYATKGNYAYISNLPKAEILDIVARKNPVLLAEMISNEWKTTTEYNAGKALRLFDKGDGNDSWVTVAKELNKRGVRVAIFTKKPEFMRKVNDLKDRNGNEINLTMLSIDSTNQELAEQNKDLRIAYVYQGEDNLSYVKKLQDENRLQVLLPVKLGSNFMSKEEVDKLAENGISTKRICPIDAGWFKLHRANDKSPTNTISKGELKPVKIGEWSCPLCDRFGGAGCFYGKTTKELMDLLKDTEKNDFNLNQNDVDFITSGLNEILLNQNITKELTYEQLKQFGFTEQEIENRIRLLSGHMGEANARVFAGYSLLLGWFGQRQASLGQGVQNKAKETGLLAEETGTAREDNGERQNLLRGQRESTEGEQFNGERVSSDISEDSRGSVRLNTEGDTFYQAGRSAKGSIEFRGDKALIRLMDTANASTLPHELAHYYLQNTFLYNKSGLATPEYSKFYQSIADYLGIDPEQEKIENWQHEKWARAYEAYLNGNKVADPNLKQAFDDYSKWIKRAYRLLKSKPKYRNQEGKLVEPKLTPEIIQTFSRLTNDFIARPDIESMAETVTSALQDAVVEVENKIAEDIRLAEKATMYSTTQIREVAEKGETGRSSVAYRILGEEIGYEVKKIEDQMEKARAFVRRSLQDAREVVNGNPAPEGLLNTAVNIAYTEVMQEMGNYEEADRAIRIRSLEQTRRGQEIAMERATTDDALSAEFWSNLALANKTKVLADSNFNGDVKTLQSFIKKKTEELANSIKGADKEERAKIIQEKLDEISKESGVLFQEDYESLIDAEGFEEILNETQLLIENSLGLKLDKEQIEYIQSNVKQLKDIVRDTVSTNGNISIEAFKQIRKMHNTIDSYTPSSNLAVWSSIVGRGVMLASIKSPVLNIISNIENYITESIVRSGTNLATKQTNDNLVDVILQSDYLKWDDEVYKASGYMPSVTENILGEVPILGERLLHSQGKGAMRWLGRFAEDTVFKYGLGYFDNKFKALTFSNVVANKATQKAYDEGLTGDQARQRANELYSDAVLLKPLTEEGTEIRKTGMIAAHETTYTQDSALSRAALKIRDVLNSGEFKAGDFLVPFVKTPANVVALGLEYSLGGLYTAYHVKDIMRDPTSEVSQKAIRAAVRNGLGVVLAMMLAALVDDDDYIPEYANASPKQRDVAKLKNAPFNSIRIGNKWISLDYFGPLAIPMAGILTARSKGSVTGFGQGVVGQALKAPGFKEVSDLIGDVTRAAQYGVSFENIAKDVASWGADQAVARSIPAFITDLGKLIDTYERETGGEMLRRIQAKIPFLREKLPVKTDITGRKIETEPTNILFGARVKTAVDNAVVKEIDRLNKVGQAPTLSDPTRYGKFRSLETKKKDKVRAEFNAEYSKQVKRLIVTGSYKRMSDYAKKNQLNKIRKKVSDELKRKHLKVSK